MVAKEEAPANYVPAAAVIRRGRALSGMIGRKGRVGGHASLEWKSIFQGWNCFGNCVAGVQERLSEFPV